MYELTYIVSPLAGDNASSVAAKVRSFIVEKLGGEVKREFIGDKKRLSYPIKKQSAGFYVIVEMQCEPEKTQDLKKFLELDNDILRHLILNVREGIPAKRPARVKPTAAAPGSEAPAKAPKVKIEELDKRLEELLK